MRLRLIVWTTLILLAGLAPLAAEDVARLAVTSIRLQPLAGGEARLTVRLPERATLVIYYDSQLPRQPDMVETFWFSEASEQRSDTHAFLLRELEPGKVYYFRIGSSWPRDARTEVLRWQIPANSKDDIIIK